MINKLLLGLDAEEKDRVDNLFDGNFEHFPKIFIKLPGRIKYYQ